MWNYRVVIKKHKYDNKESEKASVCYTYGIHEAFYDDNGHVGMITQEAVEPFGDNIEELRHSWIMMAEAFGKPILDYDSIPEPGYEREKDTLCSVLDERRKSLETGEEELIPWEEVRIPGTQYLIIDNQ